MRKEPLDWFMIAPTVAKLRAQGMSWTLIAERYGRAGPAFRDGFRNHHQQQRALQQSKSGGCVPPSPAQVDNSEVRP